MYFVKKIGTYIFFFGGGWAWAGEGKGGRYQKAINAPRVKPVGELNLVVQFRTEHIGKE